MRAADADGTPGLAGDEAHLNSLCWMQGRGRQGWNGERCAKRLTLRQARRTVGGCRTSTLTLIRRQPLPIFPSPNAQPFHATALGPVVTLHRYHALPPPPCCPIATLYPITALNPDLRPLCQPGRQALCHPGAQLYSHTPSSRRPLPALPPHSPNAAGVRLVRLIRLTRFVRLVRLA